MQTEAGANGSHVIYTLSKRKPRYLQHMLCIGAGGRRPEWPQSTFQADGAVRTGLGDGANGRADRTCNASGHCAGRWDTIVLAMALVVLLERHRS